MNENINLCELLKGHEGETFYSPVYGSIKFNKILRDCTQPLYFSVRNTTAHFTKEGKMFADENTELIIFPSKDQRDWNKWAEEQKPKVPKTWSELIKARNVKTLGVSTIENPYCSISIVASDRRRETIRETPIEKSALALLKIHQLIEVGYGGNITEEEWHNEDIHVYYIVFSANNFIVTSSTTAFYMHLAFHKESQAKEFLSYPENVQLLKDFYMI